MALSQNEELPWVEKYRPVSLEGIIAQDNAISTIKKYLSESRLPHLLLHGPPGTGKTSAILAAARQLYPSANELKSMVLELNASDDRGIGVVRDQILSFASSGTLFGSAKCKLIVLDEADSMTSDAQNALRRIIEKYTANTRFCLICNYVNSIIPALHSRCTRFRFVPLDSDSVKERLQEIADAEHIHISSCGLRALCVISKGDMRRAICGLQSVHLAYPRVVITEKMVYSNASYPSLSDTKQILHWCLNSPVVDAVTLIDKLKKSGNLSLSDMVTELVVYLRQVELETNVKAGLYVKLADVERRIAKGASDRIQIGCIVAAFQCAREIPESII